MITEMAIGLSPLLIVVVGALGLMVVEALSQLRHEQNVSASLSIASAVVLFAAMIASVGLWLGGPETLAQVQRLGPYLVIDRMSVFLFAMISGSAALTCLLAGGYLPEHRLDHGEFYPLMLLSTAGAMALVAAMDLMSIFIALEVMSIGVYALVAFRRASVRAIEGALKYFLLGSFAAALLLYGGALIYGATGHTDLAGIGIQISAAADLIAQKLVATSAHDATQWALFAVRDAFPLVILGAVLMLVGLAFKVSAVPFHAWTPDAYEGAATPVSTYMAVVVKAAAFALMLRVVLVAFGDTKMASWAAGWPPVVATLAVLTMTVANVIAVRQQSVKRMLAYSSISHAGYLLVALVVASKDAAAGQGCILFYLLVYAVATVGAFGTLVLCGSRGAEAVSYADLEGLASRHPAVAFVFSIFLLSLAGIPPLAGFFGKFYIFKVTIDNGFIALAIIGLVNSVIAAYYYLRVLVVMYMKQPMPNVPVAVPMRSWTVVTALVLAALAVVALGLAPQQILLAAAVAAQ